MKISDITGAKPEKQPKTLRISDVTGQKPGPSIEPDYHQEMISEMNPVERFAVGFDRGVTSTGQGIKQAAMHAAGSNEAASAYDDQLKDEQRLYQKLEDQSTAAKVGNIAGQVIATIPTMLIPGGQGGLAARLGSAALQGGTAAATQPVYGEGDYASQKAGQAATGAAFGAGTAAALKGAGKVLETGWPKNIVARVANKVQSNAMKTPHAQRGLQVAQETGMDLTPGAVSGSPLANQLENMSRQSWMTADKARTVDQKIANQAITHAEKLINKISNNQKSAESVGASLRDGVKMAVDRLVKLRDTTAAREYGAVRQMAGNQPIIRMQNVLGEAQKILKEYEGVAGADAAAIRSQMDDVISKFSGPSRSSVLGPNGRPLAVDPTKTLDINHAMRNRSYLSGASAGTGNLFKDIDRALDRRLASRLFGAIEQDFDAAAAGAGGNIAQALKAANANYRQHMQSIDFVKKSVLGRMLGDDVVDDIMGGGSGTSIAYEKLAGKIRTMTPSELKATKATMQWAAPEAWKDARRHVLQQALEAGKDVAPSLGGNAIPLQGNKFINALLPDENMRVLYDPKELAEINTLVEGLRRWGDKTGYNFSGTGAYNELSQFISALFKLNLKEAFGGTYGRFVGANGVAKVMEDPQARQLVMQLSRLPPGTQRAANVASRLAAIVGTDQVNTSSAETGSLQPQVNAKQN